MINIKNDEQQGFTLVELLITVAIVAVLATIAYPSFQQFLLESRRADAHSALSALQLKQENFRGNCQVYAAALDGDISTDVCDLVPGTPPTNNSKLAAQTTSRDGYYTLNINSANVSGNSFEVYANPTTKSNQNKDIECDPIWLYVGNGGKTLLDGTVLPATESWPNGLKGPLRDTNDPDSGSDCW